MNTEHFKLFYTRHPSLSLSFLLLIVLGTVPKSKPSELNERTGLDDRSLLAFAAIRALKQVTMQQLPSAVSITIICCIIV
jgi:hypothetical protein